MIPKRPRSSSSNSARMSSESSEDSRFAVLLAAATEKEEHAGNASAAAGINGEKATTTTTTVAMSGDARKRQRQACPSERISQHEVVAEMQANFATSSPGHSRNADALTEDTANATPTTTENSSHSCGTVSCSPGLSPNTETAASPFTPYKAMSPSKLIAGVIDEEPMYLRALHALERIKGSQHPEVGKALLHMARFYFTRGQTVEAEACMLGSWNIFKEFVSHYPQHERPVDCLEGYLELMKNMRCTAQISKVEEEVQLLTPKPSPMERSACPSVEANA